MLPIDLWQLAGSVVPTVEDPWPDRIGLGFPFTMAGVGSVLAGTIKVNALPATRERAMNRGSVYGFRGGCALYAVALLVQISLQT